MLETKAHVQANLLSQSCAKVAPSKEDQKDSSDMSAEKSSPFPVPLARQQPRDEDVCGTARSDTPKADEKVPMSPNSPEPGVKSVPIHCVVEHVSAPGKESTVDIDTYAIVPGTTLFCEVIRCTLVKIGYSATEAIGAKGAVQLRHWKPLSFAAITDDPDATVQDILGDLSSIATLRIKLCSQLKELAMEDIKEKLLQFLLQHGDGILKRSGCPLDKGTLEQLARGQKAPALSEDALDTFNRWHRAHAHKYDASPPAPVHENGPPDVPTASPDRALQLSPNLPQGGASPQCDTPTLTHNGAFGRMGGPGTGFTSRTRLRTSFDQEHEIPRLQKWFEHNQHPCREQMMMYVSELNALPSRAGRRPLDLTNIIYWFKNARAANRRAILAGRDGVQTNLAHFMDSNFHDNGDDNEDAFDSDVTESSGGHDAGVTVPAPTRHVPELPNRNAVYVVTPIHHHAETRDRDQVEVVNITPNDDDEDTQGDTPKDLSMGDRKLSSADLGDTTPHNLSISSDKENVQLDNDSEQAFDLSLPKKRPFPDDERKSTESNETSSNKMSRLIIKTERDGEEGYASSNASSLSPSPRSLNSSCASLTSSLSSSQQLTFQQFSQQALQMAAMSHALNMHYINPAALYASHPPLVPPVSTPPAPHTPHTPHTPHAFPTNHSSPLTLTGTRHDNGGGTPASPPLSSSAEERKKRSRVFIDPLTEIPKLEKWFLEDTHPSSYMIEKYTDDLNMSSYRQRFPRLEPKNVQLWFKNHRAKVKRARLEQAALSQINNHVSTSKSLPSTPSPVTPNAITTL